MNSENLHKRPQNEASDQGQHCWNKKKKNFCKTNSRNKMNRAPIARKEKFGRHKWVKIIYEPRCRGGEGGGAGKSQTSLLR